MRRPAEFENWPASIRTPYGPYRAVVRHVVDGDTLDALVDLGFNQFSYQTIRLAGIDAPEKNRAATKEAGLAAKRFLEGLVPVGTQVVLVTEPDPDSFGRYIAIVDRSDGVEINQALVDAGHAVFREYR